MGAIHVQHSPISPAPLLCCRHHHFQRRSFVRSLEIQALLRRLLSRLGPGGFLPRPGPNAAEIRMARQLRGLDQSHDHVHNHGCRCTLSASVFGRWIVSWLQCEPRPGDCQCRRCLPSRDAFCGPSRPSQLRSFYQRPDASRLRLRRLHAVHRIHVRDETPLRLSEGHVGRAVLHLHLLHALRLIHVRVSRPIPPKSVIPRHLTIQLANGW